MDTTVGNAGRDPMWLHPAAPVRIVRDPMTWRAAVYLQFGLVTALTWFLLESLFLQVALGMVVFWVGIPLLALTMVSWRWAAALERRLVRAAFGIQLESPYRPLPEEGFMARMRAMAADPATWRDLAYLLVVFPIALVEFVVSITSWSVTITLIGAPLIVLLPGGEISFGTPYVIDTVPAALPLSVAGFGTLILTLYAVRGMAAGHAAVAKALLGPSEKARLAARAEHLRASRARGVEAAESERRRIERDLHDGAQQRLLAVAMELGRARTKLDEDPELVRELLDRAHADTKEAIAELRNLARGIYPAILTDRGLDAALSAVAARAQFPVRLRVEFDDRPPAAVESIAYFIVCETLSNAAKYATATTAWVTVSRELDRVVVEVSDDGRGGAAVVPGGGLAGLSDRAATIDGFLVVDSPPGGPTVIRAELPCRW